MVECKIAPTVIKQQIGKDQCCDGKREHSHASVLNKWQQILKNISAYGEPNAHKYDRYEPVLLGGGSYMLTRCEPETFFREGR